MSAQTIESPTTTATARPQASTLRTGSEYLHSLNDGRAVYVDGELVKDVTKHPAFAEASKSAARLFDLAADPSMRSRMTYTSPTSGNPPS